MFGRNYIMALLAVVLIQWFCSVWYAFFAPLTEEECEAHGGIWTQVELPTGELELTCIEPTHTPAVNVPGAPPVITASATSAATPTGAYLSPTPAPAGECDATDYLQVTVEVVKNTREVYYRECEYTLSVVNAHPDKMVWVVRHTNVTVYSSALDSESNYWYSDLVAPGNAWEKQFRSSYYTNGQFSREGVDLVAGVHDRPECLYLLRSEQALAIGQMVEWACGP